MSKLTFMINAIVRIFASVMGVMCLAGCGGKSVEMGPAETVEAFCKAMTAGEWDEAEALCDPVEMREYIDGYKEALASVQASEGEKVAAIAEELIGEAQVAIDDVSRHDEKRIVTYTLSTDGMSKTRKATLKKEEGAWRVEKIDDAN